MGDSSDHPIDKPCRVCTDFKNWTKQKKEEEEASRDSSEHESKVSSGEDSNNNDNTDNTDNSLNCPLARDELGRRTWSFLHTMAAYYPDEPTEQQKQDVHDFFKLFSLFYPCRECAEDLQHQIQRFPPKTESQHDLTQWLCRVHNRINLRLGKPIFDCGLVNERWRDGWKDGSCG